MSGDGSISWFVVTTDDQSFSLSVSAPGRQPWRAVIPWGSVVRVCFEAQWPASDSLYVFTSLRAESWVVPTEAEGGEQLLNELLRRGLFAASLAVRALKAQHGLFYWLPIEEPGAEQRESHR